MSTGSSSGGGLWGTIKRLFVLAAVIYLFFTMFSMQDVETFLTTIGNGLENAMTAFSNLN